MDKDIDQVLKILEEFGQSDVSGLKINVTGSDRKESTGEAVEEDIEEGMAQDVEQDVKHGVEGNTETNIADPREISSGYIRREYHHGRCDVGSPWACGTAFDVLE